MKVMITAMTARLAPIGKQQCHTRSPCSPIKKHQQCVCFILSALECMLNVIPRQKNPFLVCKWDGNVFAVLLNGVVDGE